MSLASVGRIVLLLAISIAAASATALQAAQKMMNDAATPSIAHAEDVEQQN
jgi:hypothetical protein